MRDEQIIELYWARDEGAIAESGARYGAYCGSIAMNILVNREDADECVNDTWLHAWEAMPPHRPNALAAFFGRITRNLAITRYRANRAQKRYSGMTELLSELDDCVPSGDSTERSVERGLLTTAINNWLDTLGADDRALFVRRYWYGDALKTLAKESGVTQNQLAQRMLRLRKRLKTALEREGFSNEQ
jgi:RNA polymerase sigma-70 factor (ECF subfamily)